ncbi:MAG: hypothetical protein WBD27_12140 [Pyrinomonadaceae bacterium]
MKKLSFIGVFVLASCLSSFAQTSPDPSCPSIQVFGPAGIVHPNDIARYTAKVDAKGQKLDLTYLWSVSAGKVISGQGTLGIEVRWPKRDSITVTIEVKGVPDGCPIRASETASIDFPPEPIKLAQFNGATFVGDKLELNKIVRTMNDNPNNQLYVYFAYKQEPAGKLAQERERHAVDYLAAAIGDLSRITAVQLFDGVDLVQFWRVPPGANNPLCDRCDKTACPTISVIGPAGITEPGELFFFSAKIDGEVPKNISYRWSVSKGEVIEGQGSLSIKVRAEWKTEITLTATLEVVGLPEGCPKAASETAGMTIDMGPLLVDEFSLAPVRIDKPRLSSFVDELKRNKYSYGYIIEYFTPETKRRVLDRKVAMITNYLTKTKGIDPKGFKIVIVEGVKNRTKLYIIPPGADFPAP